ncbi:xanthine dehydrogenase molybdopterin binding subunit [Mangrovicoccus ximenensis]|uniref:xanthine dehydrogenase molybdopterin binding subunit n=1 Tax=Mangrovicoccus ximenensis TaxID=1911570 RepID=UPI000D3A0FB7|nr:xanthine dehydrogenase molybdopterin binding subunit [Mangrovicoccus ximenensis]
MSVATPLPHDAAALHVTGAARYVDDIPVPANCLHLAFGLSKAAKGQLVSLDLDAVRSAPGVVLVLTAADFARVPDCSPGAHDEPLLCTGDIHFAGQPLFLVAATSHGAARRAAALGKAEIAEETPVLSIDDALKARSFFGEKLVWGQGDPDRAITGAARCVEGSMEIGGQEHFYLESQAALSVPQEGGDMLVHSSTQHPTEIQHKVAEALEVGMHAVRVETRRMGGGFGGKESQGNWLAIATAVVAQRTGRPAKMRYDRDDDMVITGKRHDFRIDYRVGFDAEGRIAGIDFTQFCRCGWSQDLSHAIADRAMLHADNAYHLPHVRITSHRLRTNTVSATAFRGFGGPQGMVAVERVLDHVAHAVGRDPLEVRKLNYYDTVPRLPETLPAGMEDGRGVVPGPHAVPQVTPYGMPVEDFELHEMTGALAESCDYAARRAAIRKWNEASPVLKRGIALSPVKFGISFTLTHLNQAGALVHVYQDGTIAMNHGGTEMGQGLFQKVAQVAASRFGVPLARVKITATDTAKVPNTSATAASSGSDLNGMAVRAACDTIVGRLAEFIAERHQASPREVIFADDRVSVGRESYSFEEVAKAAYESRISLSATGFYKTPKIEWDRIAGHGRPFFYFAYGVACTEVVLDTLTGENRILRTDILHDCGSSLNPALDRGQVEGAYVQGAGWLTMEELVWDKAGRLRTHAPSTYKIPACSDRPPVFNVALWDRPNREDTIYRSKAVGEPPFMLGISNFLALSDAVAACGAAYPCLDAPATPERLLWAVERVQP